MSKRKPVSPVATKRLTWRRGDIQITPPKKPLQADAGGTRATESK